MLKKIKRLSLLKQYILLILAMSILFFLLFTITNNIAKHIIQKNAIQSAETVLVQVKGQVELFYKDMESISEALIYNPVIKKGLNCNNDLDKILLQKDIDSVFSSTLKLKENITGIALYDKNYTCIAKTGNDLSDYYSVVPRKAITYTDILNPDASRTSKYYAIVIPIYDLKNISKKKIIGSCIFTMNIVNYENILRSSLITPGTMMILLNQKNNVIASGGVDSTESINPLAIESNPQYLVNNYIFHHTGWKLVNIIPKSELYNQMDMIKRFNTISYIIMIGVFLMFLMLFFSGILKPVKELINFMQSYPTQRNRRIRNIYPNEFGKLEQTLNEMLDKIELLSDEVHQSQKRIFKIELLKKQMEILSYRNQINPHFLYNTFECIRAMSFYYKADTIAEITEALSKFYRYSVKGDALASVEEEIMNTREYAKIIEYRFMGRIKIVTEVDKDVLAEKVIKVILQPIVENAVVHGLEKKDGDGLIQILVSRTQDNKLQFIVRNNGVGMGEEQLEAIISLLKQFDLPEVEHNTEYGVGLQNIYRRLKLYYGDEAEFIINSRLNEGVTITIRVPLFSEAMEGDNDV